MENLNTSIFFIFNRLAGQSASGDRLIVFLADYLPYFVGAIFIVGLFFWKTPRSEKIKAFAAALINALIGRGVLVEGIRFFYHHPRPFAALAGVHQLIPESGYSFPSGHVTFFFGLSAVAYHFNKKAGLLFFILAGLIGITRIMVGVHYPFDVIGGGLIGWLAGVLSCVLAKRFSPAKTAAVDNGRGII